MKTKNLTYAMVAVFLGATLMFAPFWVLPAEIKKDTYTEQLSPRNLTPTNLQTLSAKSESSAGVLPHYPMDAISVGLMVTCSLIFALIISSRLKKKVV